MAVGRKCPDEIRERTIRTASATPYPTGTLRPV
jgi:hypothetical protein